MCSLYKNKYRNESARWQNWDYRWNAAYFITICTKNREPFFGRIINEKMILSQVGVIADICWYEIKNHANNVELGEYVIMPNHIHGIIIINNDIVGTTHALSHSSIHDSTFHSNNLAGTTPALSLQTIGSITIAKSGKKFYFLYCRWI